jgi:hypothetical protein
MDSTNKQSPKRPVAPPAYRPQPVPKVLQRKTSSAPTPRVNQPARKPVAPPVYCPPAAPKVLQKKSALVAKPQAGQTTTKPVAPPVYRPEGKKILQPKAIAAHRPDPKGIVQRATPFRAKTLPPLRGSVVQRAREHLPYELNYVMVPDTGMETYTQHVKMRTRHFFGVLINAVLEMQRQGGAVTPGMFTNHAKAQEAKGFRLGKEAEDKYDAAHLMNTTLVKTAFPNKNAAVKGLYRLSAATTTQFQKANVGPDKLIDGQQTATKNGMLAAIQAGAVVNRALIAHFVANYLGTLLGALTVPLPEEEGVLPQARAAAMRAVAEDLQNVEGVVKDIESELHF